MSDKQENILEIKQKTITGMFWRFGERILAQGVNTIVSILLARILMPEEYGAVAMVLIVINIINPLVTNGLGTALIQKKDADELDFSTMFYTGLAIALLFYAAVYFFAPVIAEIFQQPVLVPVLRVIMLRLPVAAVNSIQQAYVSKNLMFQKFFKATLLGTIVSAFVGIGMAYKGYGVWALAGQYLTNVTIDTLMLFLTVEWRPKLLFSYTRMKSLFSYGWKIMATGFIGSICTQLKSMLIGIKYTSADLSFSSQGEKIPSFLASNIETTIDSVLFPAMATFQHDTKKMKSAVRRSMKTSAYIIMPFMFGIAAVSERFIMLILSDEWLASVPYMKIACIQNGINMLGMVNLQAIKALGRSDISLKLEFQKKPFFFIILLCAMQISPFAMAVGTAFYGIIAFLINARPNVKLFNYTLKEQLADVAGAVFLSGIMYAVVIVIGKIPMADIIVLFIQILAGVVLYIVLSFVFHIESFVYILNIICDVRNKILGGKRE